MASIKQFHHISASVDEVYTALTNPLAIELWSGYPAEMSTMPGSEFSLFEGDIVGKNLEFKHNMFIKQQWYFEGETENSIVTMTLLAEKNNTVVELIHTNVPSEIEEEMINGWKKLFFGALKRYFK
jgi:activator of HSP90 ATPase